MIFSNFVGLPEGLKNRSRFLQVRCGVVRSVVSPGTIFHSSRPQMTRRWNCLSSFFPQERGSVPSWFAGSSWFRLDSGVCLRSSLFFGSGACLPSSLFFLSTWKGFCSIMIYWFLLVPAGFRCLSSFSLFFRKGVLFHHGSSSFWRGFRCLSPFFSLLLFSEKGFCSMGLCWRYCSQEKTACTSFGHVWKLRTSTLCGFLDASGRFFYCLVFVQLK